MVYFKGYYHCKICNRVKKAKKPIWLDDNKGDKMKKERPIRDETGHKFVMDSDFLGVYVKRKSDNVIGRVIEHWQGDCDSILVLCFPDKTSDKINLIDWKREYKPYAKSVAKKDKYLFRNFNGKWVRPDNWSQVQYIDGEWKQYINGEWVSLKG